MGRETDLGGQTIDLRCLQVAIAYANNDLCDVYSADDSASLLYRIVKRLHIIVHILRCGTGL